VGSVRLTDIVGQTTAVQTLLNALHTGNIFHAYLLYGQTGVGKETTALSFAHHLLCQTRSACGHCRECLKLAHNNHEGLRVLASTGSSIKIDQVREIGEQVHYGREDYLVWIIPDAHKMTLPAANSFLKLLEEPPQKTVFILITDNLEQILPTVRSRCQLIRFAYLSDDEVLRLLRSKVDTAQHENQTVEVIVKMARGSIGKALKLWDSPLIQRRRWVIEQMLALPRMHLAEVLGLSQRWEEDQELVRADLEIMLQWYRDLWYLRAGIGDQVVNLDYLNELSAICQKYSVENLQQITTMIVDMLAQLTRNVRVRFIMDNLLITMKKGAQA